MYAPEFHNFGVVVGSYIEYMAPSLFELHNDTDLFTYWQMDTKKMINGEWNFKYVKTGMAYNDFMPMSQNDTIPNFKPKNIDNVPKLQNISFLRQIAHCLHASVKTLYKSNEKLKQELIDKDQKYVKLEKKLKVLFVL